MDRTLCAWSDEASRPVPHALQLLNDNGPQYTARTSVSCAYRLGLAPITTSAYSPQSNGFAETFVHTFKRDYVHGVEIRDAESVLAGRASN